MKKILDAYVLSNNFKKIKDFYDDDINKKADHLLKCIREVQDFPIFSTVSEVKVFPKIYDDEGIQQIKIVIDEKKYICLFITHVVDPMPRYVNYYIIGSDIESIHPVTGNWREIKKYLKQMRYNDRLLALKNRR